MYQLLSVIDLALLIWTILWVLRCLLRNQAGGCCGDCGNCSRRRRTKDEKTA